MPTEPFPGPARVGDLSGPEGGAGAGASAAWLSRNAVDCLPEGGLEAKLAAERPLRVKLGIDPTAPDIHLGFTVVLQKLREFQDLGHTVVLIIGDYTARVGDPSGRSSTRPVLEPAEIDANAATFRAQAMSVLDPDRLEVRFNGEWLDMSAADLFALMRTATVARILERDDFSKRYGAGEPISILELLYPLLQGYDSVAIRADVELGGTDQKFNLLLGRDIQRAYGQPEQVILTCPCSPAPTASARCPNRLATTSGSATALRTCTARRSAFPTLRSRLVLAAVGEPRTPGMSPRDAKRGLARALVPRYHGAAAATAAEEQSTGFTSGTSCRRDRGGHLHGRQRNGASAGAPGGGVRGLDLGGAPRPRAGRVRSTGSESRRRRPRSPRGRARRARAQLGKRGCSVSGSAERAMTVHGGRLRVETQGEGEVIDIHAGRDRILAHAGSDRGVVTVFVIGSTAAVTTNYEPGGIADLRALLDRVIPTAGDYEHNGAMTTRICTRTSARRLSARRVGPLVERRMKLGTRSRSCSSTRRSATSPHRSVQALSERPPSCAGNLVSRASS